jgi:hypothetical protein
LSQLGGLEILKGRQIKSFHKVFDVDDRVRQFDNRAAVDARLILVGLRKILQVFEE